MKINWEVRINNPVWWAQICMAIILPILSYFGMSAKDVITWSVLWDMLKQAVSNPYVLVQVVTSVFNTINDPTTAGLSDSDLAMTYEEPKKSE